MVQNRPKIVTLPEREVANYDRNHAWFTELGEIQTKHYRNIQILEEMYFTKEYYALVGNREY